MGPGCEPTQFSEGGGSGRGGSLPTDSRSKCEDGARDSDSYYSQPLFRRLTDPKVRIAICCSTPMVVHHMTALPLQRPGSSILN
jgi:hypothetical protein